MPQAPLPRAPKWQVAKCPAVMRAATRLAAAPLSVAKCRDGEADHGSTDRPVGVLISADHYDLSEP